MAGALRGLFGRKSRDRRNAYFFTLAIQQCLTFLSESTGEKSLPIKYSFTIRSELPSSNLV